MARVKQKVRGTGEVIAEYDTHARPSNRTAEETTAAPTAAPTGTTMLSVGIAATQVKSKKRSRSPKKPTDRQDKVPPPPKIAPAIPKSKTAADADLNQQRTTNDKSKKHKHSEK
jgi:hypothetical protein